MSTAELEVKSLALVDQLTAIDIENVREVSPDTLRNSLARSVVVRNLADDLIREIEHGTPEGPWHGFRPLVKAAHDAHKKLVAQLDALLKPAEDLKRRAGELGASCNKELKRRQDEADAAAERDRKRLQDEADAAAERERLAAQEAAEEARLAEAVGLEQAGDAKGAAALIEEPVVVAPVRPAPVFVPPPVQIAPARIEGASFVESWGDFVIEDEALIPREYLTPDLVKIRKVVAALRKERPIPGIKAAPKSVARRTGR